jgi:hypothetical protein
MTTRQLAQRWSIDYWTVVTRPRLHARADAVLAMSADIRAGALAAQGKPLRDARGRFVKGGGR